MHAALHRGRPARFDALGDREAIHAICEECRAPPTSISRGTQIAPPTNASAVRRSPWGTSKALDNWHEQVCGPLDIWRKWATDVTGRAIAGGHFFPEQNPDEAISELRAFFE